MPRRFAVRAARCTIQTSSRIQRGPGVFTSGQLFDFRHRDPSFRAPCGFSRAGHLRLFRYRHQCRSTGVSGGHRGPPPANVCEPDATCDAFHLKLNGAEVSAAVSTFIHVQIDRDDPDVITGAGW